MFRRKAVEEYEVDAIVACEDKVFMVEVRSTPRLSYVDRILERKESFFDLFHEYKGKELIVILGSISVPEDVIKYASKKGIYVMGWREWEYMGIMNFDKIGRG